MARLVATCALLALASSSELVLDGGDDGFSKSYYKSVDGVMGGKSSISISYGANSMIRQRMGGMECRAGRRRCVEVSERVW